MNKCNSIFIGYFLRYFNVIHTSCIGHLMKYIMDYNCNSDNSNCNYIYIIIVICNCKYFYVHIYIITFTYIHHFAWSDQREKQEYI